MGDLPSTIINWLWSERTVFSVLSCSVLIPGKMSVRHFGFVFLIWFPGVLHGKKIKYILFIFLFFKQKKPFTIFLSCLSLFQHKVQSCLVVLPNWMMVILSHLKMIMLIIHISVIPVAMDVNQLRRVGGQRAHVRIAHGLLHHNA